MVKLAAVCLCAAPLLAADGPALPRHLFAAEPLTAASAAPPRVVAEDFVRRLALAHDLEAEDLAGLFVAKEYRTAHNGVIHLVFRQRFQGLEVCNAEWTVNIDRDGQVLNAGGTLAGHPVVLPPVTGSAPSALRAARAAARPAAGPEPAGEAVWFRVNGVLRPAWLFYIRDENGIDYYATVVDAETEQVLARRNLTLYQGPPRGLVFERGSPQPSASPGVMLTSLPPYVERTVQSFAGAPAASPRGWVSGAATAGNNVIAAPNLLGIVFVAGAVPALAPSGDFSFPLELGPGAPNPLRFRDAATTNLFYWANRAHDLFYQLGFDEAAGHFQQDNFGRGGVGGDPMLAFSQFGAAGNSSAALNNAFYTSSRYGEDGARASINMYLGMSRAEGVFSDGSFDAGVILHEYTHGVSSRLVRQLYDHHQGGALGEGWSDFFALEFTLPEGAPADGVYGTGEYLFQLFGTGIRTRPYSTRLDVNPLTFRSLGRVREAPEVHGDGEIWMQALWEMRASLIRQFGEKEGRRRARLLVIDGMKLSPPAPTMVDARDALLLADRVDFRGASQAEIWAAFAKRGLGVLAHSASPDSIHILASFETPSAAGALRFCEEQYVMGETVRIVLHDANLDAPAARVQLTTASGDLESLMLFRAGSLFWGSIRTASSGGVSRMNGALEVIPHDDIAAYYLDSDAGGSPRQIEVTAAVRPAYVVSGVQPPFATAEERALFSVPAGARVWGASTRRALPFSFPFFDRHYTSVRVYSDGLLAFDLPKFAPCSDRASLALTNGVAPLWMDLAYGGGAQRNENVYLSSGPGWVTFRWAAETQPASGANLRPEPVNFSATLYDDGRIYFQYGEGNRSLLNSPVTAASRGCSASGPTVGISNGHETYVHVVSSHDGRPDLEKAASVTFEPPLGAATAPVVTIEAPAPEAHQQGLLTVRGIAYDEEWDVTRLDVLIDGVARARTTASVARADFCATQRVRGCPNVGFSLTLDPARLGLAPGPHQLRIRATNARASFQDHPAQPLTFFLDPGEPAPATGALEAPAGDAELAGAVQVKGYAYSRSLRLRGVDVLIDGVTYGAATYSQRREDICGPLTEKPPNCPNVGFTYNLNTRSGSVPLPNGPHTLQVRARDELDRYTLIPETPLTVTVNNPSNQLAQGVLATPKPNETLKGRIRITGHGWDPDGRVTGVALLLDGVAVETLRYGLPRPDECAQLTGVTACPNIGFEGDFDTTQFANGPHVLGIRLTDNSGATVILPRLARNGMNILLAN